MEHASNAVPEELGSLGLALEVFDSHVAWDPGALEVATKLADRFDLPLERGEWTRLVVDLNRSPDNPDAIPENAFGTVVPANLALEARTRRERLARYHTPYWDRVVDHIDLAMDEERRFFHISVHSFVEQFHGVHRDVDIGLLADPKHRGDGEHLDSIQAFINDHGLDCRVNEPWDGRSDGLTTNLRQRYPPEKYGTVEFEISQRHLGDLDRITRILGDALDALGLFARG